MTTTSAGLTPQECLQLLIKYRLRWIVPTIACAVLATGYALVMSRYWQASQALVVRNEVSAPSSRQPGKFSDLYEMRTFQETIFELAKSRQVLAATMKLVEESETGEIAKEPTTKKINVLRNRLKLSPPDGAEFGKTEVFYLSVKDKNRDHAVRLVDELCQQLDQRLRQLRNNQAESIITELEMQVELSSAALKIETAKLEAFETEVGSDLGELRMLHSASSGQSDLRQQTVTIETEYRRSTQEVRQIEQLLTVLRSTQDSPEQLIAMPSTLLISQPTLRSLKDGMVAAQLRVARLAGTRTPEHPQWKAATKAVEQIREDLHNELQVAIQGLEIELGLNRERTKSLSVRLADVQRRLIGLAQHRAEYTNRLAAVENSRAVLTQTRKQLSEIRAVQVAAQNTRLVTPLDRPEVGDYPVGIGRASVVLVGTFGGFAFGLGFLFFTVAPTPIAPEYTTAKPTSPKQAEQSFRSGFPEKKSSTYPTTLPKVAVSSTPTTSAAIVDAFGTRPIANEVTGEPSVTASDSSWA